MLSLFLIQSLKSDPELVERIFRKLRFGGVLFTGFCFPPSFP